MFALLLAAMRLSGLLLSTRPSGSSRPLRVLFGTVRNIRMRLLKMHPNRRRARDFDLRQNSGESSRDCHEAGVQTPSENPWSCEVSDDRRI
ncbi:hypothetical protein [Rhizobacter fulvus]